jgi:hypothetical protein
LCGALAATIVLSGSTKPLLEAFEMAGKLKAGAFVELRGRPWLVEETVKGDGDFESLSPPKPLPKWYFDIWCAR